MVKGIWIGQVFVSNNLILAPMAGYTDAAMRRLCREAGVGLTVTEMVSAKGLMYKNKNTADLLKISEVESPSCVQLFGSEAEVFFEVIRNSEELAPFDIIDINMGCPVRKIVSSGEGSALLYDIKKAAKIVERAAAATSKPITVKIRIPDPATNLSAAEAAKILAEAGAKLVAIHGRTAKMMYGGKADHSAIHEAAKTINVPIIANGDLIAVEQVHDILGQSDKSAISGAMIGRAAIGNPKIFAQILSKTKTDPPSNSSDPSLPNSPASLPQYFDTVSATILKHIDYMEQFYGEHYTVLNMRKHLAHYVRGMRDMKEFKSQIHTAKDLKTLRQLVQAHVKQ